MKREVFGHLLFDLIFSSSICLDNVMDNVVNIFSLVFEDEYSFLWAWCRRNGRGQFHVIFVHL